jgi:Cd2+/Zn2+-exporting ATPase
MNRKQKKILIRIIISAIFALFSFLFMEKGVVKISLNLFCYIIIGYDILKKAFTGIINSRPFDENVLMAVATIGAIVLGFTTKTYDFFEAFAVMFFYQTGELFQSIAVGKSRKNIKELMNIRPDYANIEKNNEIIKVSPERVGLGDEIIVYPGEKVPVDGYITEGESSLNTVAITGESNPLYVQTGSEVLSGFINLTGVLKIKTTTDFKNSTVSKILALVEEAGFRKSRSEKFISKFARVYTPVVLFSALFLGVVPPLVSLFLRQSANWSVYIYRALTFLVISCPCALVISVPLSFFATIGGASKKGILIKGSDFIEVLSKADTVVFDKTGTLTSGTFSVKGIHHNTIEDSLILEYAAYAEYFSLHPAGKSLQEAYGKHIDIDRIKNFQEISGKGVFAEIDGKDVIAGNEKLMEDNGIEFIRCSHLGTVIHMAVNGEYKGHILICDREKKGSSDAIRELKRLKISDIIMLSGDKEKVAEDVAKNLGIDTFLGELSPVDKVNYVENLLKQAKKPVVFVGDGINDAPVLTRADIGISMGKIGSDAAVEASDIVITDDDPEKIPVAINCARKCMKIVKENICFSLAVKALCLVLTSIGAADMALAIFADVGVMILAILNSSRTLVK